ncbi:hypothetical protein M407DRAFT_17317 [Tulasnella calospora MUT 4182]|uniref:Uncharacterized protein n=1 Tax=Tulasnella calospora MUT 4182 TaxID=1051891 RepID=A0A0C3MJ47_9AGAM|nr:hypothetical protein M407DRAFT_17317 [Tulasnella calospora MUT 4182]
MTDLFCTMFANSGECNDTTCRLNHTNCMLCQQIGLSRPALWAHMQLGLHLKRLRRYYPLWRRFLNHVHAHGGWKGVRIPWDPEEAVLTDAAGGNQLAYDARIRAHGVQDLQSLVVRTSTIGLDALDEVEELGADADLHRHEDDGSQICCN